jgi:hypothetical protein
MSRIVTYVHRYKRPPRKTKAVALEVPPVVRGAVKPAAKPVRGSSKAQPANDDRKPVIVTQGSAIEHAPSARARRKQSVDDGTEASPEIKAFFARMMRAPGS